MSTPFPAHTSAVTDAVPVYQAYMNPILVALRSAGRPLLDAELDAQVIEALGLAPEVVAIPHDAAKPDRSEVSYRLAWARTYLQKARLLNEPRLGLWALTEEGWRCGDVDARSLVSDLVRSFRGENTRRVHESAETTEHVAPEAVAARGLLARLRETHEELLSRGDLLPRELIEQHRQRFREAFGPEVLARLDGEALLVKMHERTNGDSLVCWLEFEQHAQLGSQLGGIGGGTALKFGLYRASCSGAWMTGTRRGLEVLSTEQAIACARVQRDQLVRGAELLRSYSRDPMRRDFAALQAEMERVAPDLVDASWAHKYFSSIVPSLIGCVHELEQQRYLLIKLLRTPGSGRYENAGQFLEVATALAVTPCELAAILRRRFGSAHAYWRLETSSEQGEWARMRDGNYIGVGWRAVGDLAWARYDQASQERVRELMQRHYAGEASAVTSASRQLFAFVARARARDLVAVTDGMTVQGIGRIRGDYLHRPGDGALPHRRPVEWLSTEEWRWSNAERPSRTFHSLSKHSASSIQVEARVLHPPRSRSLSLRPSRASEPSPLPLEGPLARIQAVLQRKGQVILYGPPGTGKTYWADRAVRELSARSWFGVPYDALSPERRLTLEKDGALEVCTFHPAYGYEDFVEGDGGARLREGLFKRVCQRASKHPKRDYHLMIDELDRGDVGRIFGELSTLLEHDQRGRGVTLPLSGEAFSVPANVFLVGTMNTAHLSTASLDAALRRRFGFIELLPDSAVLGNAMVEGLPLGAWLDALNQRILRHAERAERAAPHGGRAARLLPIGHSYLMSGGAVVRDASRFAQALREDIIPLLQEYCADDLTALEQILSPALVRRADHRINEALFMPGRHAELIEALCSGFPELSTAPRAIAAEIAAGSHREDDEVDDEDGDAGSALAEELASSER